MKVSTPTTTDSAGGPIFTVGSGSSWRGVHWGENDDAWLVDDDLGLYVVCDALGKDPGAEIAARIAVYAIAGAVDAQADRVADVKLGKRKSDTLTALLRQAFADACRAVHEAASTGDRQGMGCTATAVLVAGRRAAFGHVGHGRLYLVREGEAHQLTRDHTLAAEMAAEEADLEGGEDPGKAASFPELRGLPTRSLGPNPEVLVDAGPVFLRPGDRLVLCTQGAWWGPGGETPWDRLVATTEHPQVEHPKEGATVVVIAVKGEELRPRRAELEAASLDQLQRSPFFAHLDLRQLHALLGAGRIVTLEAGAVLVRRGEPLARAILVVDGALEAVLSSDRATRVEAGELIGWSRLVGEAPSLGTVSARGQATVMFLEADAFRRLAWLRPGFGVPILLRVSRALRGGRSDLV